MIFEFSLIGKRSLPTFRNYLGNSEDLMNICFDTGCGITTFYMDIDTIRVLYPDIQEVNSSIKVNDASGGETPHKLYKIPSFDLKDRNGNILHIKDMYCCLSPASIPQIDVLLSGALFYNAKAIITPRTADEKHKAGRFLIVDTFLDGRNTMYMQKKRFKHTVHYICVYNAPSD